MQEFLKADNKSRSQIKKAATLNAPQPQLAVLIVGSEELREI